MTRIELDETISEIYEKAGAFFAFSQKQFDEQIKENTRYTNCKYNLFCPSDNVKNMFDNILDATSKHRKWDIKTNGKKKIIWRELANYEAQITMDIGDAVSALADYEITEDEVKAEWKGYFQNCIDNDYF